VGLNVAVADASAVSVRLHAAVPLHAPDQPVKVMFALGVALRVTAVPLGNVALHVCPQLMPAGLLVIVPAPEPVSCTVT